MDRNDIFNAIVRRDAALTKALLAVERTANRGLIRRNVGLKDELETTTAQLRTERKLKRRNPYTFTEIY